MKHLILTLAFACAALLPASADNLSESILRHVASTLREYGDYEVRFTVSAESMGTTGGEYVVSGDRYRIRIRQQEQFSDGKNRYEIYEADREVVIDRADTKTHDIFTNPTRAFDFAPAEFESTYRGKEKVGRKEAHPPQRPRRPGGHHPLPGRNDRPAPPDRLRLPGRADPGYPQPNHPQAD